MAKNPLESADLRSIIERLYKSDQKKFRRLFLWAITMRKEGWSEQAIYEALKMSEKTIPFVDNFWPYVTKLLPKGSGRAAEKRSDEHKRGDMEIAFEFVEFLKGRGSKSCE